MSKEICVGLALGGGGGRGIAHIGVLAELESARVPVHVIAGTSAGSLVGVLYAAGLSPEQMLALAMRTKWSDLVQLTMPRVGLVSAARMENLLNEILHNAKLEELPVKVAAVACDLYTGREVVLRQGNAAHAIKASCAVPGIFSPVPHGDALLADGGIVNGVPVDVVRGMNANLIIAVRLHQGVQRTHDLNNIFAILSQSFEVMQRSQHMDTPDVLIVPELANHHMGDLAKVMPAYEAGRVAARTALPAILKFLWQ